MKKFFLSLVMLLTTLLFSSNVMAQAIDVYYDYNENSGIVTDSEGNPNPIFFDENGNLEFFCYPNEGHDIYGYSVEEFGICELENVEIIPIPFEYGHYVLHAEGTGALILSIDFDGSEPEPEQNLVTYNISGEGTISGPYELLEAGDYTLTISPADGYYLSSIDAEGEGYPSVAWKAGELILSVLYAAPVTINATFDYGEPQRSNLNVTTTGPGSVYHPDVVEYGSCKLSPAPFSGAHLLSLSALSWSPTGGDNWVYIEKLSDGDYSLTTTGNVENISILACFEYDVPPAPTYSIYSTCQNGWIETDAEVAAEGQTVTVTVHPNTDLYLHSINVNNNEVVLTKVTENVYTFTMPGKNAHISAICAKVLNANENPQEAGAYYVTYFYGQYDTQVDENTTIYKVVVDGTTAQFVEYDDDIIPFGKAVVLKSTSDEIVITPLTTRTTADFFHNNALMGVNVETSVTKFADQTIYTLAAENNHMAFYRYIGNTLAANKAFLWLSLSNAAPHRVDFVLPGTNNPIATDVEEAASLKATKTLVNGKLVIVRGVHTFNANGAILK